MLCLLDNASIRASPPTHFQPSLNSTPTASLLSPPQPQSHPSVTLPLPIPLHLTNPNPNSSTPKPQNQNPTRNTIRNMGPQAQTRVQPIRCRIRPLVPIGPGSRTRPLSLDCLAAWLQAQPHHLLNHHQNPHLRQALRSS